MIYTTLNKIREHYPCKEGWEKILRHLGKTQADDDPLALKTILESNGLDDTLWCLRTLPEHNHKWRLYAVWCARQVQHLMADQRSINALDVAERHANGTATDEELAGARKAAWEAETVAWAAAGAAWAARAAAGAAAWAAAWAAWAARAAGDAAGAAAGAAWAAWAAGDAARAAAGAAWAARAAGDAAGAAAGAAAKISQTTKLLEIIS